MLRNKVLLSSLVVLVLLFTSTTTISIVQAPQETKTLEPKADSSVSSESPNFNVGRYYKLEVWVSFEERFSFLMFDLSEIPSGAVIEEAKLRLYTSGDESKKAPISVYHCPSNDWTEDGITYNNKPSFSTTPIDTANVTNTFTWYTWNVTGTVQSTVKATDKRLSLVLKADSQGWVEFMSKNSPFGQPLGSDRPKLVVSYTAPPPSGTNPILTGLIVIGLTGAAIVGLTLTYTHLKKKKPTAQTPQPTPKSKLNPFGSK